MKTILKFMLVSATISGFVACNGNHDKEQAAANNLKIYVDSVSTATVEYTEDGWKNVNTEYENRIALIKDTSALTTEERAELASTKERYSSLKVKYEDEITRKKQAVSAKQSLRNKLFGVGIIGDDMSFAAVNAGNLLATYTTFVDAVANNKDNYSREDWDEIKVLYEALDTRKNEVEKDLATKDNLKIAQQKIRFSAIKSVNRPLAKAEENNDAKK